MKMVAAEFAESASDDKFYIERGNKIILRKNFLGIGKSPAKKQN